MIILIKTDRRLECRYDGKKLIAFEIFFVH